ncbi:MAG TPA: DUF5666 domain-containing protein [Thermoanaerobaculia bacterium]|nr:DUF5666 domain-containing protein [Thermoanaerobaculia bacterium]
MHKTKVFAAAVFALLLAAACGSSYDYGDNGTSGPGTYSAYDIHGTVDSVDTNNRSIYLTNVSNYNNNLRGTGGYGSRVRVYYDNSTTVMFQGRNYHPEDLQRGDEVTVHGNNNSNGTMIARSMDVTYDINSGMASSSSGYPPPYPSTYPSSSSPTYNSGSTLSGTVRSVDTYNHTLTIDPGYGSYVTVDYRSNVPVYYNGRTYAPGDIEIGDQVNVRVSNGGTSRVGAQDITVTRSISTNNNGTYNSSTQMQTVRGTVRYVDTNAHTIELDSTSWMNGFQPSNASNTIIIHYDPTARVDVSGQFYPLSNLERGDVIDVSLEPNGSSYLAQRVSLVRDVRSR